ncbi:hypothetical protein Sjap_005579 [Stephania japonica]|uniref:Uncharacterized protein n=1 Tax=Stephania japonica TaxID=461633 RepID=A0AAP0PM04_9MAGN
MFSLQLRDWLDLSLNHALLSSLLILSRAFTVSGKPRPEEAVMSTMSSLPDELVDTIQVTSMPSEDSVSEMRRKLEFLEMQEELIKDDVWLCSPRMGRTQFFWEVCFENSLLQVNFSYSQHRLVG